MNIYETDSLRELIESARRLLELSDARGLTHGEKHHFNRVIDHFLRRALHVINEAERNARIRNGEDPDIIPF